MAEIMGMVTTGRREMAPALFNPSPRTRLRPTPRNVRARPLTTWSAWKWMVTRPWSRASIPAASIAARSPNQLLAGDQHEQNDPLNEPRHSGRLNLSPGQDQPAEEDRHGDDHDRIELRQPRDDDARK